MQSINSRILVDAASFYFLKKSEKILSMFCFAKLNPLKAKAFARNEAKAIASDASTANGMKPGKPSQASRGLKKMLKSIKKAGKSPVTFSLPVLATTLRANCQRSIE